MKWEMITNIILGVAFLVLLVFVVLGICQWISRKSLKKVDKELLLMPVPLALMAVCYFVFDKILILNTRPNGSGEASFPSTHVMVAATIFLLVALILPRYIKKKAVCVGLDLMMLVLVVVMCVGRVLANMHWVSDVAGGLIFAAVFAIIYVVLIKKFSKRK